jgi:hypothetical protein
MTGVDPSGSSDDYKGNPDSDHKRDQQCRECMKVLLKQVCQPRLASSLTPVPPQQCRACAQVRQKGCAQAIGIGLPGRECWIGATAATMRERITIPLPRETAQLIPSACVPAAKRHHHDHKRWQLNHFTPTSPRNLETVMRFSPGHLTRPLVTSRPASRWHPGHLLITNPPWAYWSGTKTLDARVIRSAP